MEERMEKLEATAERWLDEKPRLQEVLFDLADRQLKPFGEDTETDLKDLRALGLIDRMYAANYKCQEGWQLLGPGKRMVHRRRARAVAPSGVDAIKEMRDMMASDHIPHGIAEMNKFMAEGIPRNRIAELWGRAEVPEPEEEE
jgi:hypothetical protein